MSWIGFSWNASFKIGMPWWRRPTLRPSDVASCRDRSKRHEGRRMEESRFEAFSKEWKQEGTPFVRFLFSSRSMWHVLCTSWSRPLYRDASCLPTHWNECDVFRKIQTEVRMFLRSNERCLDFFQDVTFQDTDPERCKNPNHATRNDAFKMEENDIEAWLVSSREEMPISFFIDVERITLRLEGRGSHALPSNEPTIRAWHTSMIPFCMHLF